MPALPADFHADLAKKLSFFSHKTGEFLVFLKYSSPKIEMALEIDFRKPDSSSSSRFSLRTRDERYKKREAKVLLEGGILIVALVFGLILRLYAYEGALITSRSMAPTLSRGDYLLIDHRAALRGTWKRGEIVFFNAPASWGLEKQTLVKRIIALPGETVAVFNGVVLVNGQPLKEPYLKPHDADDFFPIRLGQNEYFVMGDNRDFSEDSRDFGPISEKEIRGRIVTRLWPISVIGTVS